MTIETNPNMNKRHTFYEVQQELMRVKSKIDQYGMLPMYTFIASPEAVLNPESLYEVILVRGDDYPTPLQAMLDGAAYETNKALLPKELALFMQGVLTCSETYGHGTPDVYVREIQTTPVITKYWLNVYTEDGVKFDSAVYDWHCSQLLSPLELTKRLLPYALNTVVEEARTIFKLGDWKEVEITNPHCGIKVTLYLEIVKEEI